MVQLEGSSGEVKYFTVAKISLLLLVLASMRSPKAPLLVVPSEDGYECGPVYFPGLFSVCTPVVCSALSLV